MAFYTIHPREIASILMEKRAIVIDVRGREAYREHHYRNARNYPYDEIEGWACRLPKKQAAILYCDYGSTSLLAARRLSKEGIEAYTVVGGIHAIDAYEGSYTRGR